MALRPAVHHNLLQFRAYGQGQIPAVSPQAVLSVEPDGTVREYQLPAAVAIPVPKVRLLSGGQTAGAHDRLAVGGPMPAEYNMMAAYNPVIALMRYKRGGSVSFAHHNTGYKYDNRRGYVHPSPWIGGGDSGSGVGHGKHTTVSGNTIPDRETEWGVTGAWKYDAIFEPELWFLDKNNMPYTWPIAPIASPADNQYELLGSNGQGSNDTGTTPRPIPGFCNSTKTRGVQEQYFAFCYMLFDPVDPRNVLFGAMSKSIKAEIWPKIRVTYTSPQMQDRGRKIKLRYA